MVKKSSSTSCSGALKVKYIWKPYTVAIYIYNYILLELNSLIQKLDKLQEGGLKKGGFKQKPRVQSTPSLSFPPENAPKWAITQRDDVTREETAGTSMSFSPVSVPETSSISVTHTSTAFTEPHISEPPFTGSHSSDFHAHADIIDHLSSFSDSDSDD